MLGCSALKANSPAVPQVQKGTTTPSGGITLNPKNIGFGNVPVGKTQAQTVTLSNPGIGTVTIAHAAISGPEFALTGPRLPLILPPKRTATLGVSFTPTAGGTHTGTISLTGSTRSACEKGGRQGRRDRSTAVTTPNRFNRLGHRQQPGGLRFLRSYFRQGKG
jgi:hypothetical protein